MTNTFLRVPNKDILLLSTQSNQPRVGYTYFWAKKKKRKTEEKKEKVGFFPFISMLSKSSLMESKQQDIAHSNLTKMFKQTNSYFRVHTWCNEMADWKTENRRHRNRMSRHWAIAKRSSEDPSGETRPLFRSTNSQFKVIAWKRVQPARGAIEIKARIGRSDPNLCHPKPPSESSYDKSWDKSRWHL